MRILWNSSNPDCDSGYGIVSRELIKRLRREGHFIRVATKHAHSHWSYHIDRRQISVHLKAAREACEAGKPEEALPKIHAARQELEGVEVFEGTLYENVRHMLRAENFDLLFTLWDIWGLVNDTKKYPPEKWVAYVPIDTETISKRLQAVVEKTGLQVAMSRHGERELKSIGMEPYYAPHGVDTSVYYPDPEGRARFRQDFGLTDKNFLIGNLGVNYGIDDRKGFIPLLRAFRIFHKRHPESRLFLHTHARGRFPNTVNLIQIVNDLGMQEFVYFCNQEFDAVGRIENQWIKDSYNGLDVLCLPSKGEGFGLTLIEAQACGTPVVTTHTTTGPELAGNTGWLIDTSENDLVWQPSRTWRYEVGPEAITETLEMAYNAWKYSDYKKIKEKALVFAKQYDWDVVWDKYWRPLFKTIETNLETMGSVSGKEIKDDDTDKTK